ncbi:MAG: hypothetical protein KDD42_07320, partial [Bdellovibrionales bacterium]|nr:hypothetical protein [Bdellovibrionales bacterium]
MNVKIPKLILDVSIGILAVMIFATSSFADDQRITRECPFSCSGQGFSDRECDDFRDGNQCTIVIKDNVDEDRNLGGNSNDRNNNDRERSRVRGGTLCLTADGDFTVRRHCRAERGETEVTLKLLPTLADVEIAGIPAGTTVYGVVGSAQEGQAGGTYLTTTSLPLAAKSPLLGSDIIVARSIGLTGGCGGNPTACLSGQESALAATCGGTTANPTAPMGKLCVYVDRAVNLTNLEANPLPENNNTYG